VPTALPTPVSQILFKAGDTVGSTFIVPLADSGSVDLHALYGAPPGDQADLSVDVLGYLR